MLLSMTGYGKAVATYQDKTIHVEVKALNSKALDCSTRLAPVYREKEMEIRKAIQESVVRGKIDFSIWVEKEVSSDAQTINMPLFKNYYEQLVAAADSVGIKDNVTNSADWMKMIMRMPDIMSRQEAEVLTDEEWAAARKAVDEALCNLEAFRRQEGAALKKKFEEKLDNIARLMGEIEPYEQSQEPA